MLTHLSEVRTRLLIINMIVEYLKVHERKIIMTKIEACIFDGSGVLINDVNTIFNVSNKILEELRINPVTFEDFQSRTKIPFWEYYKSFGLSEEEAKATDFHFKRIYPLFAHDVTLYPEVKDVLQQLKSDDIKIGMVTHLPKVVILEHLINLGIRGYFDSIVTFDDTDEHKPSPKPLLIALSQMNVNPQNAVFVGDMIQDILTGKRAGVKTIAMIRDDKPYQLKDELVKYNPDYFVSNLTEILHNGIIV